eukprot:SAG31_NODE_1700_length_7499_cov_2.107973_4_plen_209_part_00
MKSKFNFIDPSFARGEHDLNLGALCTGWHWSRRVDLLVGIIGSSLDLSSNIHVQVGLLVYNTHRDTETQRHTDTQTHRHTDTHTDTQTHRHTHTHTHTHTHIDELVCVNQRFLDAALAIALTCLCFSITRSSTHIHVYFLNHPRYPFGNYPLHRYEKVSEQRNRPNFDLFAHLRNKMDDSNFDRTRHSLGLHVLWVVVDDTQGNSLNR